MYLLSRKIKALGFKVVMSGEGADEVFGGYLYFHKAPNAAEFHRYGSFPLTLHGPSSCLHSTQQFAGLPVPCTYY